MSLCAGCLWLSPNLIFQLCSASILTQPLCQEMISRWGLIWRWTLILDGWIKREDGRVAVEGVNVQQCHGRMGDATSSLQHRAKTERPASMVSQLLEMRGVQKEATRAQEQVLVFLSLQTNIQRRLREEIPVSGLWEQTPSDDVESSTIIAALLVITLRLSMAAIRRSGQHNLHKHHEYQHAAAAGAATEPSVFVVFFEFQIWIWGWWQRLLFWCEHRRDELFNDVVKYALCGLRAMPLCLSLLALGRRC